MSKVSIAQKTNLQVLEQYMYKPELPLTAEQQELLLRIQYADELIRTGNRGRDEVINAIVTRFGVSKWRADQDVTDAGALFGRTRKLNTSYILAQHIEDIRKQIQIAKTARRWDVLPKLNENVTSAIKALPPQEETIERSPTTIIFVVQKSEGPKLTIEQLIAKAKQKTNTTNEYIEFTEESSQ